MEPGLIVGISVIAIMLFGLLMERFRLPMVIGVLLAGAFMGPASPLKDVSLGPINLSMLVISDSSMVEFFALLGSVLILFGIGLEFSVIRLAKLGFSVFFAAIIKLGLIYITGYFVSSFMGVGPATAVLLGFVLSFSSTPIITKILDEYGKLKRPESVFIIAVLVLEDLIAVALLGILASANLFDHYVVGWALFKVAVAFVIAYLALSRLMRWLLSLVDRSDELLLLFSVGAVLLVSYASAAFGLGFSVGSFLTGSAVATTQQAKKVEELIRPFNALFVSFFFFSIGLLVDINAAAQAWPFLLGLLLVAVFAKIIASAVSAYLIGFSGRSAAFAAAALLPESELALLIGSFAAAQGIFPTGLIGLLALIIILTSLISVWLVGREGEFYSLGKDMVPLFFLRVVAILRSIFVSVRCVVKDNSRYERILGRLPSLDSQNCTPHERLYISLRNMIVFAIASAISLFVWKTLIENSDFYLSPIFLAVFFGFFISATFSIINASSAISAYSRISRNSGNPGLEALMHFLGSLLFSLLAFAIFLLSLYLQELFLLVLLIPTLIFGFSHLKKLLGRLGWFSF
jgi:Kef-type K+ transport system membrane component KefB